jgi:hypothetical protein
MQERAGGNTKINPPMELIAAAGYSWRMLSPYQFVPIQSPGCAGAAGSCLQAAPMQAG